MFVRMVQDALREGRRSSRLSLAQTDQIIEVGGLRRAGCPGSFRGGCFAVPSGGWEGSDASPAGGGGDLSCPTQHPEHVNSMEEDCR